MSEDVEDPPPPEQAPRKKKRKKRKAALPPLDPREARLQERIDAVHRLHASALGVLFLRIVTCGLYELYWVYARRSDLEAALRMNTHPWLMLTPYVIGLAGVAFDSPSVDIVALPFVLSYLFRLRSSILRFQRRVGVRQACSGLGVFLLGTIWIQTSLNSTSRWLDEREEVEGE